MCHATGFTGWKKPHAHTVIFRICKKLKKCTKTVFLDSFRSESPCLQRPATCARPSGGDIRYEIIKFRRLLRETPTTNRFSTFYRVLGSKRNLEIKLHVFVLSSRAFHAICHGEPPVRIDRNNQCRPVTRLVRDFFFRYNLFIYFTHLRT